jgi:hypothetical protein
VDLKAPIVRELIAFWPEVKAGAAERWPELALIAVFVLPDICGNVVDGNVAPEVDVEWA